MTKLKTLTSSSSLQRSPIFSIAAHEDRANAELVFASARGDCDASTGLSKKGLGLPKKVVALMEDQISSSAT